MSQDQVVEFIKNLKLSEVKDLISRLEEELGVSASAPVMVGAVAGAGAAAAAAPVEEQTEFTVVLKDAGAKKIDVIKAVREITGLGLKEAKDLVEAAPTTVKEAVPKKDVAEMKKKLEDAGATVELK